jgi:hypothetical protein
VRFRVNHWIETHSTLADDGTMNSTSLAGGLLTFTPNKTESSYLYEQIPCTAATTQGFDLLSFAIKGPEAASVSLELQTQANCSTGTNAYTSYYYTVNGLSGSLETVTVPLSSWTGANLDAIVGVLFFGFSKGMTGTDNVWQIDNIALLCKAGGSIPPLPTPTTSEAGGGKSNITPACILVLCSVNQGEALLPP